MKRLLIITTLILASVAVRAQGFNPVGQKVYYTIQGPSLVEAELSGSTYNAINTFPMERFNNMGTVNGVGCNPIDSCIYYINNSGGNCHLYKMDGTGQCTHVTTLNGYTVNGGVDACGRYVQYKNSMIIRYDIQTGFLDTINTSNLGAIMDIDYNPNTCTVVNDFYSQGNIIEVDTNGVILQTITSPQPGTNNVGGLAVNHDGSGTFISNFGSIWEYDLLGNFVGQYTLNPAAAGAPIADLGTFQFDDVIADVTSGQVNDTLTFITCDDSVEVTFINSSIGNINDHFWDFGDGTTSTLSDPVKKFESNNIYQVVYRGSSFTCETCQIDQDNYDTIWVEIIPDVLQTTVVGTDPLCVTSQDGSAEVTTITGGTAPYAYNWIGTSGSNPIEPNLGSGWVYVEVTGANGCYNLDSVYLNSPAPVQINLALTNSTCFQSDDGTATAAPINPGTYTYAWSSSGNATANEINIPSGPQSVVVTNQNGCDTTYLFSITEPTEVTVAPNADTTICILGTAVLDAVAAGGNGGYTIDWVGIGQGTQNVSPAINTCYDVQATDVNGCVSQIQTLCVDLHSPLNVTVAGTDICPGTDASLTSNSSGGFGNYSYVWDVAGAQVGTNDNLSYTQTTSTTYCLTITDGCETPAASDCITINVFSEPQLTLPPQTICERENVIFPDPAVNPSEVSSYSWDFGDGNTGSGSTPNNIYDYSGSYTVTVDIVSTDNCNFQTSFVDLITVSPIPDVSFQYNPQVVTIEDTEVDFYNNTNDATSYIWSFGDGATSSEENPSHFYPAEAGTSYTVTLHAYNGMCYDSIQQTVHVEDIIIYYIPNAFTPDGDELNQEFKPIITSGIDIYEYHMIIFDRWGEIIFESYNPSYGWDGHYGDGGLVPDGTYVWTLEFGETMSDKQHRDNGHVTVLK